MSALVALVGLLASVHLKTPKILVMQIARYSRISNRTKLITQNSGLKSLTGKELVNNQYVINSVNVLTMMH